MSHVVKKERCPKCRDNGGDRSGDNLAVYSDGHSYCFACAYRSGPSLSAKILRLTSEQAPKDIVLRSSSTSKDALNDSTSSYISSLSVLSRPLPPNIRKYLLSYGITDSEIATNGIFYDDDRSELVYPISVSRSNARYFGNSIYRPKYITTGPKDIYKLFRQPKTNVFVFVEDFLSAIKVGRQFNCVPLLGSHFNTDLLLAILSYNPRLRIWLDYDKSKEAIKLTKRSLQYIKDCGTIITEKDPKCYTDKEIKKIVQSTLSSPSEGVSTKS